jgi:predicted ribosome quality control (RQC) complex YloA/Tae2 family protein
VEVKVDIGFGSNELKVWIGDKDISENLTGISIEKSVDTIPEVTLRFRPDKCNINVDTNFVLVDKGLDKYSVKELASKVAGKIAEQLSNTNDRLDSRRKEFDKEWNKWGKSKL